jgi:hypothetical protein
VEDSSPAARAYRATRRLRQQFEKAGRAAKGQARLRRADEHELLRCAYAAVRCWRQDRIAEEIQRELRGSGSRNQQSIKPFPGAPSHGAAPP